MTTTSIKEVLDWLEGAANEAHRAGLARYGIPTEPALGVPMAEIKRAARRFGPAHEIIFHLWETGIYEARVMAIHLADPAQFRRQEANRWTADFDNWALCDTASFHLFDRTPFRWEAARDWALDRAEYVRRAGFATLWGLSVHDKSADDRLFQEALEWANAATTDERVAVKKSVDMALRAIGKRNLDLNAAVCALAASLVDKDDRTAQWIGRHVFKELTSERVQTKLALAQSR